MGKRKGVLTLAPVKANLGELLIHPETIISSIISSLSVEEVAAVVERIDERMGRWEFTHLVLDYYLQELKTEARDIDDPERLVKYQMMLTEALVVVEGTLAELLTTVPEEEEA